MKKRVWNKPVVTVIDYGNLEQMLRAAAQSREDLCINLAR